MPMTMFRDFYGGHACIRTAKSGAARLTVRTPQGKLIHAKTYKTERGARIAMGRLSDGWYPVSGSKEVNVCPV